MNIIIRANRKRFPIVFVISLMLAIGGGINITRGLRHSDEGIYWWTYLILLAPSFFCIISLLEFIKTRFDKNAVFKISDKGLEDNLSIFSCGNIPWADIKNVQLRKAFGANFLIVGLLDNKKYISGKNFVIKHILGSWVKKWGSPVVISEQRVNYNLQKLEEIISHQIDKLSKN